MDASHNEENAIARIEQIIKTKRSNTIAADVATEMEHTVNSHQMLCFILSSTIPSAHDYHE